MEFQNFQRIGRWQKKAIFYQASAQFCNHFLHWCLNCSSKADLIGNKQRIFSRCWAHCIFDNNKKKHIYRIFLCSVVLNFQWLKQKHIIWSTILSSQGTVVYGHKGHKYNFLASKLFFMFACFFLIYYIQKILNYWDTFLNVQSLYGDTQLDNRQSLCCFILYDIMERY